MNSILDKVFSFQYFGIILFSVIGILAVLFVILFAVAIKDAKKNKINNNIEEQNEEEKNDSIKETNKKKEEKKTKKAEKEDKKEEVKELKKEEPQEEIEEVSIKEEIEIPIEEVIEPQEDNDIDLDVSLEKTLADLDNTLASLNITKEDAIEEPVIEDVKIDVTQENEDLQNLAMSLVKDYKKEKKPKEVVKEEKKIEPIAMPNLDDIPMPQAIKVIDSTPINNPKKRTVKRRTAIDSIVGEEYKLK